MHDPVVRAKVTKAMQDYSAKPEVIEKRRITMLKYKVSQRPQVRQKIRNSALNRDRSQFRVQDDRVGGAHLAVSELCKALGTTYQAVHSYVHSHACDIQTALKYYASTTAQERKQKAHAAQVEAARQKRLAARTLYVNGEPMTLHAASKAIGRSGAALRAYAKRHGITLQEAIDAYLRRQIGRALD